MFCRIIPAVLICVFVLSISGCGGGGSILDLQSPFSMASQTASLDQVQRTIITACGAAGWSPSLGNAGHVLAYRRQAGRIAKVDITYTNSSFNIRYLDSDNMGYDGKSVSSTYSQWVGDLRDEIKHRLSQL